MRALALLLLLASCRSVDLVPSVAGAYHEDTDSYSTAVSLSFVPGEVDDARPFRDDPGPRVEPLALAAPLEPLPAEPSPLSLPEDEEPPPQLPTGDTVTIETPWGPFAITGLGALILFVWGGLMLLRRRRARRAANGEG